MAGVREYNFKAGYLVRILGSFKHEPVGCMGFIYDVAHINKKYFVFVISENGVDLGGFNIEDQEKYLQFVRDTGILYTSSPSNIKDDFNSGWFDLVF